MDGHRTATPPLAHLTPLAPAGSNLAVRMNRAIDDRPAHTAGGHLLSVVEAATNVNLYFTISMVVTIIKTNLTRKQT